VVSVDANDDFIIVGETTYHLAVASFFHKIHVNDTNYHTLYECISFLAKLHKRQGMFLRMFPN
jgi:hypothetical protein